MADRRRDLDKLRKIVQIKEHDLAEELERRAEELRMIREQAEHTNRCSPTYDKSPPFIIDDSGDVFSARDGKPITTYHQTLADEWYFDFLSWRDNPRGLLHDPQTEAFYLPDSPYEVVFSRERCNLACFWWAIGDEGAHPWGQFGPERLDPDHAKELEPWL